MNLDAREGAALAREVARRAGVSPPCTLLVCPPFTAIAAVAEALVGSPVLLGGQNLHPEPRGAFTGEISGAMLAGLGCRFVLVGHSERRHGMGEDDALVAGKLRAALRDHLVPVVCVGETLAEREGGRTEAVLERQVRAAYQGLEPDQASVTVIAYEPVWAIGTGRVAGPDQAAAAHGVVRATLDRVVAPGVGARACVLYGGSVSSKNAAELFAQNEVDGALVGGASLDADGFWAIAESARKH